MEVFDIFSSISFLWLNLILENRTQEKNPFLEKSFLSVRKSIDESHLSEDIKKEFSRFLAFDVITEKNFKRIFEINDRNLMG